MSSSPPAHNTRLATKRKRLANQEDAPPPKTRKTVPKLNSMLSEVDPSTAETAETRKRKRTMKRFAPKDVLDPEEVGTSGTNPPLRYYGWPFKYDQVLKFAQRHHIHFDVSKKVRSLFGGKEEMDFADLSDKHYNDPDLMQGLRHLALLILLDKLARTAGIRLDYERACSLDWDGVIYVWSNYDAEERFDVVELLSSWERAERTMSKAMSQMSGQPLKPQWWWSKQSARRAS